MDSEDNETCGQIDVFDERKEIIKFITDRKSLMHFLHETEKNELLW